MPDNIRPERFAETHADAFVITKQGDDKKAKVLDAVDSLIQHLEQKHAQHNQSSHASGGGGGGKKPPKKPPKKPEGPNGSFSVSQLQAFNRGEKPKKKPPKKPADTAGKAALKAAGISLTKNGGVKLKTPKDARAALTQVKAMQKMLTVSEKHWNKMKGSNTKASVHAGLLFRQHAAQFQRSIRNAKKMLPKKSVEGELGQNITKSLTHLKSLVMSLMKAKLIKSESDLEQHEDPDSI